MAARAMAEVESLASALRADIPNRVAALRELLRRRKLDALLVLRDVNVGYLSGFTGGDSALLVGPRDALLVTDSRFVEEARETAPGAKVVLRKGGLFEECIRQAARRKWWTMGFEANGLTYEQGGKFVRAARAERLRPKPAGGLVEDLRAIKSPAEIDALRAAVRIAEKAGLTAKAGLREGRREIDIAIRVARRMQDLGASEPSFDVIAALDARSSLPHAQPGEVSASRESMLLLDWGARYLGYCSDLTRVFRMASIPAWLMKAHCAVLDAQRAAVARVGPGVKASDVDAAARDVLRKAGFGRNFGHGVGHGLGLEIHEAPRLGPGSGDVLRPGMVITIEPGVYFPGVGGVRIEDDVAVTDGGAELLSRLPREI